MKIDTKRRIRAQLRAARAYKGMTLQQAAESIGVHLNTIHRLESGAAVDIGLSRHLIPLCKSYGVDPVEFLRQALGDQ
jgi:transcriptional regulator with XRE-family HTH domain